MKTEKQQKAAAAEFAKRWEGRGYEKGDSQVFWTELLTEVYGVKNPSQFIRFEQHAQLSHASFIDALIPATATMIEQKSIGKDLREPIKQSDGTMLTPFEQARRYISGLPRYEHPKWIVTCNFSEFDVYDMDKLNPEPQRIFLKDLGKEYYRLQFLVETGNEHLQKEMEVSMKAGELVGRIYDSLIKQYDKNDPKSLRYLNILCVRLVFCLYAEDAGIFGKRDQFHDYLSQYKTKDMRSALIRLFHELNTPYDNRDKYDDPDLAAFPYTNGGLFAEEIEIPQFTDEIRAALLLHASIQFDWSEISPTIFGGVFESTLNPVTRRNGGMHYTSIENIHKLIDPLFLNGLTREFEEIMEETVAKVRVRKLHAFQDKLASLTFFDPACGSGNFLTETYLSLRRLENKVIQAIYSIEPLDVFTNPIKVSINQFYGIEINDFAVTVATTALWISESQMMAETEHIVHHEIDFLPLHSYANIREGNALRMEWDIVERHFDLPTVHAGTAYVIPEKKGEMAGEPSLHYDEMNLVTSDFHLGPKVEAPRKITYDYIIGNPPFVGANAMNGAQREDLRYVFGAKWKNIGEMDYVCAWYKKAVDLMQGTKTKAALVSTNSITQGEQVANLWTPLLNKGIKIDFAYRTFQWDSESTLKAHVHVVIIGFTVVAPLPSAATSIKNVAEDSDTTKNIYDNGQTIKCKNINPYLIDAPNVLIGSRPKPLCDVPAIRKGNQPTDGGNLIIGPEELEDFLKQEPKAKPYIKRLIGSREFINNKQRYCLWLVGISPAELRRMPLVLDRVRKVRKMRLASKAADTNKLADRSWEFRETNNPKTYIIVPSVSSEKRRYVPMGFLDENTIPTNLVLIIPDATLYLFGILESNVHMAWMRVVCGRLKSDYRYSKDIVYNNFPWPSPTDGQRQKIAQTAQAILDARAKYPDSSLADLYDPTTMPYDLLEAHRNNDRAVMAAYGFSTKMTESECVARLFGLYAKLTE